MVQDAQAQPGQNESQPGDANNQQDFSLDDLKSQLEEKGRRLQETSAEAKKYRQTMAAFKEATDATKADNERLKQELAEKSGNWQQMAEEWKSKYEDESKGRKTDKAKFAFSTVSQQFSEEAAKLGCQNTRHLVKLAMGEGLLGELDTDDDFNVSQDSLKAAVEKAQKEFHYLFGKQVPSVNDLTPGKPDTKAKGVDFSKMSVKELEQYAKEKFK